ncbi:MAG: AmmeMemoRadiSam system protein A [Planctomycetia bacterium]|nr:AmmeMemoRadiSam system protein A [Planctomycetia bacterium]
MLTPEERKALLGHARESVRAAAAGGRAACPAPPADRPALLALAGAFVTLHSPDQGLRGCIGFVEARRPLWPTVWDAAREAAVSDPRFEPVAAAEVDLLTLEISVLGPLLPASALDVRVGEHGIVLSRGPRRGLLLPQVPVEHGWDRDRFLEAACDKAGLPRGAWRDAAVTLEIFSAEVFGT